MKPKPIAERIDEALADGPLSYHDLAAKVFPHEQFPRAWKYSSNGGPPGCYMALTAALNRYGFDIIPDDHNRRIVYGRVRSK